ncbi:MAG: MFS transporter [Clostridiales bacterium]|nr:MFS transporter [Clostridiales bacterium]
MGLKQKFIDYKDKNLLTESIPLKEQLGYVGGSFGHTMSQDCMSTYGEKFQRTFAGIDNNKMYIKDNFTIISGFFFPPIVGAFYDSLNSKRSNIKLGLRFAPIPFTIASLLMFVVPSSSSLFNLVWVIFLGLLFHIGESFYKIGMDVLALKLLQKNPDDRKNFYTFASLAQTIGSMLPGWLLPIVVDTAKGQAVKQQWLYFFVALGFCMIGICCMYAPSVNIDMTRSVFFAQTEGSDGAGKNADEKVHWNKKNIALILHNRPFIIVQLATMCEAIRKVTYDALPYLYDDVFCKHSMKSFIDPISGGLGYVGLIIFPTLFTKFPAHKIAAGGYSYAALFYFIMFLFNIGSFAGSKGFVGDHKIVLASLQRRKWLLGALVGLSGMPNYAQSTAKSIVVADSTDYMEWYAETKYGESIRSDGLLLAAQGLIGKINDLLKKNLSNTIFKLIDFKTGAPGEKVIQTPKVLRGIFNMVSLCAFFGNLLAAICFLFDNYYGDRQKKILAELNEFRKARGTLEEEMKEDPVTT